MFDGVAVRAYGPGRRRRRFRDWAEQSAGLVDLHARQIPMAGRAVSRSLTKEFGEGPLSIAVGAKTDHFGVMLNG